MSYDEEATEFEYKNAVFGEIGIFNFKGERRKISPFLLRLTLLLIPTQMK